MPSRLSRPLRRVCSGTCELNAIRNVVEPPGGMGSARSTRSTVSVMVNDTSVPSCVSDSTR